jgi:hypothetical protein
VTKGVTGPRPYKGSDKGKGIVRGSTEVGRVYTNYVVNPTELKRWRNDTTSAYIRARVFY